MDDVIRSLKELRWMISSYNDYMEFPQSVHDAMGFSLHLVQAGKSPINSKKLKGAQLGAIELITNHDGDTYRAVYTVRFAEVIYVLHAFKKKSKKGIATPKSDLDIIRQRLRIAEADYNENFNQED